MRRSFLGPTCRLSVGSFFQWQYANSQPDMLANFVTTQYRTTVRSRMLIVPMATTLTVFICFWSVGISLAIYLLLLPLYMLPGKLAGAVEGRRFSV